MLISHFETNLETNKRVLNTCINKIDVFGKRFLPVSIDEVDNNVEKNTFTCDYDIF